MSDNLILRDEKIIFSSENHFLVPQKHYFKFELLFSKLINISWFRIFQKLLYQGGVQATVFWVFEDLKFKISEGYDQNWCFPDSAQLAVSV